MSKFIFHAALVLVSCLTLSLAQTHWDVRMEKRNGRIMDVLWTGSQFIAVDFYGAILTSPEGETWTVRDSQPNTYFTSIRHSPTGRYVAAAGQYLAHSADGITWKRKGIYPTIEYTAPIGKKLVGITSVRVLYVSENDTTWERREEQLFQVPEVHYIWQVASSGDNAVAVGHMDWKKAAVLTSADGNTWTVRYPAGITFLDCVVWAKDRYFASSTGVFASSPDGVTWTSIPVSAKTHIDDVAWTGTRFVAVGGAGKIMVSPDGLAWETVPPKDTLANFHKVIWARNRLLLAGSRQYEKFIVTMDEDVIGIAPIVRAGPGFTYAVRDGWLQAEVADGDRLVRACLRNTQGALLRETRINEIRGGMRMPLAGVGRGAYVLELESLEGRRAAPILLAR